MNQAIQSSSSPYLTSSYFGAKMAYWSMAMTEHYRGLSSGEQEIDFRSYILYLMYGCLTSYTRGVCILPFINCNKLDILWDDYLIAFTLYRSCAGRDLSGTHMLCDISWLTLHPINALNVGQYINNQNSGSWVRNSQKY